MVVNFKTVSYQAYIEIIQEVKKIKMKIIFLDIDGVLNVFGKSHDQYGKTFHKHFENNLKYIIEQTNAKIVLSSTWRFKGLQVRHI